MPRCAWIYVVPVQSRKGDDVVGNQTRVKVVKNKVAPPFKQAEFEILYGEGISREGELIDLGVNADLLDKSGAWYSYAGNRIGQGKENVRNHLKENPDIANTLEKQIRSHYLAKPDAIPEADMKEDEEAETEAATAQ